MREPSNPVDPNAIGVIRICHGPDDCATFAEQIGYLSKEMAQDLAPFSDEGPVGFAEILEITGNIAELECLGVNIRAEIYVPGDCANDQPKHASSARSRKQNRIA